MMVRPKAADQRQSVGQLDLILDEDSAMLRSKIAIFGNILVFKHLFASLPANRDVMHMANAEIGIAVNGGVNHLLVAVAWHAVALIDALGIVAIDVELRVAPVPAAFVA